MWRCQREKLKEDAIQCCGKKQCEKEFLSSCGMEEKTITYTAHRLQDVGYCIAYEPKHEYPCPGGSHEGGSTCYKSAKCYKTTSFTEVSADIADICPNGKFGIGFGIDKFGIGFSQCLSTRVPYWTGEISVISYFEPSDVSTCFSESADCTKKYYSPRSDDYYPVDSHFPSPTIMSTKQPKGAKLCQTLLTNKKQGFDSYVEYQTYRSCFSVINNPCEPKTASESPWYGKTVLTNYKNCLRQKGSFSPFVLDSPVPVYLDGKLVKTNPIRVDVGYCTVK